MAMVAVLVCAGFSAGLSGQPRSTATSARPNGTRPIADELISLSLSEDEKQDFIDCVQAQYERILDARVPGPGVVLENCVTSAINDYSTFCPNACSGTTITSLTVSIQVVCGGANSLCCLGTGGSVLCGDGGTCCMNSNHGAYCCAAGNTCESEVCVAADGQCFPGDALVQVMDRGISPLTSLRVGERVLVQRPRGEIVYEPVLSFLHAVPGGRHRADEFLTVAHTRGQFRVSANHLVFVRQGHVSIDKLAADLDVGDQLMVATSPRLDGAQQSTVLALHKSKGKSGMYAPLTASGTIVVDGVVASNYAAYSSDVWIPHGFIHAVFSPARLYYSIGIGAESTAIDVREVLHPYVELMQTVHHFVSGLGLMPNFK